MTLLAYHFVGINYQLLHTDHFWELQSMETTSEENEPLVGVGAPTFGRCQYDVPRQESGPSATRKRLQRCRVWRLHDALHLPLHCREQQTDSEGREAPIRGPQPQ